MYAQATNDSIFTFISIPVFIYTIEIYRKHLLFPHFCLYSQKTRTFCVSTSGSIVYNSFAKFYHFSHRVRRHNRAREKFPARAPGFSICSYQISRSCAITSSAAKFRRCRRSSNFRSSSARSLAITSARSSPSSLRRVLLLRGKLLVLCDRRTLGVNICSLRKHFANVSRALTEI